MAGGDLVESFLGALQASLSVILTIFYGVLASQFNLLDKSSGKAISKICVRMFLPALLITKVGSELHLDTAIRYLPILSKSDDALLKRFHQLTAYDIQSGLWYTA